MHQPNNIKAIVKTNNKQQGINSLFLAVSLFLTSYATITWSILILSITHTELGMLASKIRLWDIFNFNPYILNIMAFISGLIILKTHRWLTWLNLYMLFTYPLIGFSIALKFR